MYNYLDHSERVKGICLSRCHIHGLVSFVIPLSMPICEDDDDFECTLVIDDIKVTRDARLSLT